MEISLPKTKSKPKAKSSLLKRLAKNKMLYLMITPGLLYLFIYKYIPMFGMIISFQNYKPYLGIAGSEWVGLNAFQAIIYFIGFLDDFKKHACTLWIANHYLFPDTNYYSANVE